MGFLYSADWDAVAQKFGALVPIYGTLVTALIAMLIAVPVSFGIAMFLTEIAPNWMRGPVGAAIELLAGIPSIIYGMWGLFVLVPFLAEHVDPWLDAHMGRWPVIGTSSRDRRSASACSPPGSCSAIMVIPFISSVMRDVFLTVPATLKESAYALGSTPWEVVWDVVLPYTRSAVVGGIFLGLGRALGETMAVTFVLGNAHDLCASLLVPGNSIAATIANEFTEADSEMYRSSLIALGFVLFLVTFIVLAVARAAAANCASKREGDDGDHLASPLPSPATSQRLGNDAVARQPRPVRPVLAGLDPVDHAAQRARRDAPGAVHADDAAARRRTAACSTPSSAASLMSLARHRCSARRSASRPAPTSPSTRETARIGDDRALRQRHPAVGAVDRARPVRLHARRARRWGTSPAGPARLRLPSSCCRWSCAPPTRCCGWCRPDARGRAVARRAADGRSPTQVLYRAARAGIVTGILLALARISGETAPLLFTALNNQYWTTDLSAADGQRAGGDLPVRDEPLRRLAQPGLGRRIRPHPVRARCSASARARLLAREICQ